MNTRYAEDFELLDAHLHLFRDGFAGEYGRSPAGGREIEMYESLRTVHHIRQGLVIAYEGDKRYLGNNETVLTYARDTDWIVPLAYVPVHIGPYRIRELLDQGFAGIVIYALDEAEGLAVANWHSEAFAAINERSVIVSINATPEATHALERFVDLVPNASVLFSHLGLPGSAVGVPPPSEVALRLGPLLGLANRDNVGVKLSGLYAISKLGHSYPHHAAEPYVEAVLEAFGPDRVSWGSDFPVCLDFVSFVQTVSALGLLAALTEAERRAIAGGNLAKVIDRSGRHT